MTDLVSEFLQHTANRNTLHFDEKYVKLVYKMILTCSNQFNVYDEFASLQGFIDIIIFKAPASTACYEAIIELKYLKKSEATEANIEKQLAEGVSQINYYMQDERLTNRENFKKFVIVFVGFEVARLVEL